MTRCDVFSYFLSASRSFRLPVGFAAATAFQAVLIGIASAEVPAALVEKGVARPSKQADALYDKVEAKDISTCTGEYETRNGVRGVLISSGNGQPLRWLADVNGDGSIDHHCFYKDGVESYRDMDTDYDGKIDQSRWLGMSGMRWGIDKDQDGTIDAWKMISAEEVSYEAVEAVRTGDLNRFERLLITADELDGIGLGKKRAADVLEKVEKAATAFRALIAGSKTLDKSSRWASFGADKPGIVPAGTDESTSDIVAYENAMAVLETSSGPQQLVMGTLVRVGDTWRMIDAPRLAGEETALSSTGIFFASTSTGRMDGAARGNGVMSADAEKLIRDMEAIEKSLADAKPDDKAKLHAKKADVLQRLIEKSSTAEDAKAWTRQLADQVLSAVQSGEYPDGVERLRQVEAKIEGLADAKSEAPYVAYRILTAEYTTAISAPNADFQAAQTNHVKRMEDFVERFPEHPDAADAMIQLGLNSELANELEKAEKWYKRVEATFEKTSQGDKAHGAIQRLNLVGQQITFSGNTINGKTFTTAKLNKPVIVHYWASWCGPCKADMKEFKKLQTKYGKQGLTVVGINADNDPEQAIQFLKTNTEIDWVQLHEKGGLESKIAVGLASSRYRSPSSSTRAVKSLNLLRITRPGWK